MKASEALHRIIGLVLAVSVIALVGFVAALGIFYGLQAIARGSW